MVGLQPAICEEMAQSKTGANKRLGWFRRNPFPLFDAVPPANHNNVKVGKEKEEDTSSGKSMSHGNSDDGSLDARRIQRVIESDPESPPPTSTAQDKFPTERKTTKKLKIQRNQSSETEELISASKPRKPFHKRPRKSAAQAGEDFIDGLDSISDKLITHMSNNTSALASGSSAQPYDFLTSAPQGLQKLGLTQDELYDTMDLLKKDVDYAKMFVGLGDIELQLN